MFSLKPNHFKTFCLNISRSFYHKTRRYSTKPCSEINSSSSFGQPSFNTHPYLMKQNEVTPFIQRSEFIERREMLVKTLISYVQTQYMDVKRFIVVIPSATKQFMSDKIPFVFRQNSEFLYLVGCQEPDSCLVLQVEEDFSKCLSILFLQGNNAHTELWEGPRTSPQDALNFFGVDQSFPIGDLGSYLILYFKQNTKTVLWYDVTKVLQVEVHDLVNGFIMNQRNLVKETPVPFLHHLRLIKSPAEIFLMKKSCEIASEAIVETIKVTKPGVNEQELFAKVDYECRIRGAERLAYPPVIGGGNRANIIHYISNNQQVQDGELVLMDAGCEYHGYSSDITRTFPVNREFTAPQKEIYQILYETQNKLIHACKNFPSLDSLYNMMCVHLGNGLQEIGLIDRTLSGNKLVEQVQRFCPHHVSHYLGMDVHDTPAISRKTSIKPGMIITVEPGLYLNSKNEKIPERYRGIGMRIEDDVVITENGPVVLTSSCPKTIEDIESIPRD